MFLPSLKQRESELDPPEQKQLIEIVRVVTARMTQNAYHLFADPIYIRPFRTEASSFIVLRGTFIF